MDDEWREVCMHFIQNPVRLMIIWVLAVLGWSGGMPASSSGAPADLAVYAESLASGWADWSWNTTVSFASHTRVHGGSNAIAVTFSQAWDGFQLGRSAPLDLSGYNALRFWIHGGSGGQTIQVSLSRGGAVCLSAAQTVHATASWQMVEIPLADLGNPPQVTTMMWFNNTSGSQPDFYLDDISFVSTTASPAAVLAGPALSVDAAAGVHSISQLIYGMNFADEDLAAELKLPVRRWGGNATTRYNWQNDTSNHASDWYFQNIPNDNSHPELLPDGSASDQFIDQDRRTGTQTLLTVPLIGWTPKSRARACGFSIAKYGGQDDAASDNSDCGNGLQGGAKLTGNDPKDTSTAITPSFVQNWIAHLKTRYGSAASGGVSLYNLDNEPMLWNSTHRDVHPLPVSYDEMKQRTIDYAAAIKAADPGAQILGPVLWGWSAYFYSAKDVADGGNWWDTRSDRKAHGDVPFLPWYLQQMKAYNDQTGTRILDYVDVHIYPQGTGVFSASAGDASTQALRLRSTRALWDRNYVDESWIADKVYLIPRLHDWVAAYYPGTRTAISEYSWGAMCHINGALAQADVLGIFGREQLDLATLWDPPTAAQPGAYAFRMYRNYDGLGSTFGDLSVSALSADPDQLSIFAAKRAQDGALTVMVINKSSADLTSAVNLSNFAGLSAAKAYRYSSAQLNAIQTLPDQALGNGSFNATFVANSITLWVIPASTSLSKHLYLATVRK